MGWAPHRSVSGAGLHGVFRLRRIRTGICRNSSITRATRASRSFPGRGKLRTYASSSLGAGSNLVPPGARAADAVHDRCSGASV